MNSQRQNLKPRNGQCGMTIIELMIAIAVLFVGMVVSLIFINVAMGSNFRNRQGSNSTAISQMLVEKIMSVGANVSPTLTINDCAGNPHNINTAGAPGPTGSGGSLAANGDIDFTQAPGSANDPAGYYMLFTDCGTNSRQIVYDVRWNIQTPTADTKLITVSTRMSKAGNDLKMYSPPATVRSLLGP